MPARLTRAAALVAIGIGVPAGAQLPGRVRDTIIVRTRSPEMSARIDSINVLFRALENEPPMSAEFLRLRRELDQVTTALERTARAAAIAGEPRVRVMLQAPDAPRMLGDGGPQSAGLPVAVRGWIGLNTGFAPFTDSVQDGDYLVRYFEHPAIISVEPNSPAEQAGIAPGDVLLAYNGLDVVGRWVDVTRLLEPQKKLSVRVARDGDTKTYTMVVAHAPGMIRARRAAPEVRLFSRSGVEPMPMPNGVGVSGGIMLPSVPPMSGFTGAFPTRALFGASLTTVNEALAKALHLPLGLLASEVPEGSPAYRAGLRAGDVIVKADGTPVTSASQLLRIVMAHVNDQSVPVDIVRNHKARKLTLDW